MVTNKYLNDFIFSMLFTYVILLSIFLIYEQVLAAQITYLDFNNDGSYSMDEIAKWTAQDHVNYARYKGEHPKHIMALIGYPIVAFCFGVIYTISHWMKDHAMEIVNKLLNLKVITKKASI